MRQADETRSSLSVHASLGGGTRDHTHEARKSGRKGEERLQTVSKRNCEGRARSPIRHQTVKGRHSGPGLLPMSGRAIGYTLT